eukprot:TRINITY_DN8938_c0_g1_i1.p1 TRINITY_DN8938_c0_g1~~TRINITY_DN8938_c0_g1_i1.p1  ORF type:complete len:107 (-),score=19.17 TRINITY_DN8938_c0_g1_i1:51-371(-)
MDASAQKLAAKKETILDLTKFLDKPITVKFNGGREVQGMLKGYDQLVNLTLDDAVELIRDPEDPYKHTGETRFLGLVVCRGSNVMLVCPVEGYEVIDNPFKPEPVI